LCRKAESSEVRSVLHELDRLEDEEREFIGAEPEAT
jgi:hypothetical protein